MLLKGPFTLIAEPNQPMLINTTGNPGMASGGTGDVLAGLLGGLIAQGLTPFDAAVLVAALGRAIVISAFLRAGASAADTAPVINPPPSTRA